MFGHGWCLRPARRHKCGDTCRVSEDFSNCEYGPDLGMLFKYCVSSVLW